MYYFEDFQEAKLNLHKYTAHWKYGWNTCITMMDFVSEKTR